MSKSIVTTKINSKYSSGGGGGTGTTYTIGTIDTQTKSANGLVITGSNIVAQTADDTYPGLVSTGTQTFKGPKTFYNNFIATANDQIFNGLRLTSNFTPGAYTGLKKSWINLGDSLYLWEVYKNVSSATEPSIALGNDLTGNSSLATGNNNISIGPGAGQALTGGTGNTFFGLNSGSNIVNGINNICIGGGSNTLSDNTNSIVIGGGATGQGSNTVVLGNDNITTTYLKGGLNISSSSSYSTSIKATLRLNDSVNYNGTQLANNSIYLTLDGSGTLTSTNVFGPITNNEVWTGSVKVTAAITNITGTVFNTAVGDYRCQTFQFMIRRNNGSWGTSSVDYFTSGYIMNTYTSTGVLASQSVFYLGFNSSGIYGIFQSSMSGTGTIRLRASMEIDAIKTVY